jgi:hypothetical protein
MIFPNGLLARIDYPAIQRLRFGKDSPGSEDLCQIVQVGKSNGFRAVSFVPRPLGLLPARRQQRQYDAAGFTAILNIVVPVVARLKARFIEPDAETRGGQASMDRLGVGEVLRSVGMVQVTASTIMVVYLLEVEFCKVSISKIRARIRWLRNSLI